MNLNKKDLGTYKRFINNVESYTINDMYKVGINILINFINNKYKSLDDYELSDFIQDYLLYLHNRFLKSNLVNNVFRSDCSSYLKKHYHFFVVKSIRDKNFDNKDSIDFDDLLKRLFLFDFFDDLMSMCSVDERVMIQGLLDGQDDLFIKDKLGLSNNNYLFFKRKVIRKIRAGYRVYMDDGKHK